DRSRAASHYAVGQSRDGSARSAQRESRAGRHRVFEGAAQRARGIAQGQGISARQEFYDRRPERSRRHELDSDDEARYFIDAERAGVAAKMSRPRSQQKSPRPQVGAL